MISFVTFCVKTKSKRIVLLNNPNDVQFLNNYAANVDNIGYGGAQALLQFVFGTKFEVPRLLPEQNGGARLFNNQTNTITQSEVEASSFKIFPNPTNGMLTVELPFALSNEDYQDMHIQVTNSFGQVVYTAKLLTQTSTLNLNQLNSGIYMLAVYSGKTKLYQTKAVKVN